MPRQRRGTRGDVGIAPYAPPTEIPCVTFGQTDPSAPTHAYRASALFFSLSFRGREAPVGIRPLFISTAAKGRHLPLPQRGKGAI